MKLTALVLLLVAHLVASERHCNPVIAYHGSDCTCESKLPYQVQTPEQKSPVQVHSYAFAIRYPLVKQQKQEEAPATYNVEVQEADQKELQNKLTDISYKIRKTKEKSGENLSQIRYQYNVQVPHAHQGHVHLTNLESCVDRWDLPRNCKCDGQCNCPAKLQQRFEPHDDSDRNAMRYRRSTTLDSVEKMTGTHTAKVKSIKPKKVKSHKPTDEYFKNLQGDSYVLERIRRNAEAGSEWGLLKLSPPNLPSLDLPNFDLDSINSQIHKNMEALRNFHL